MHDWTEKLLLLQEKDLRIARLEEQLQAVPVEKARASQELQETQVAVTAAQEQVRTEEKAIKVLELDVESTRTKMRDFQSKSAMIKNNEEYRAALTQIEACRQRVSEIEDQELAAMERLDQARRELDRCQKLMAACKQRVGERVVDLDTRLQNCSSEIASSLSFKMSR